MKNVVSTEKRPIKLWLDDIEDGAMEQAGGCGLWLDFVAHINIMKKDVTPAKR